MMSLSNALFVVTALIASVAFSSVCIAQEQDQKADKTGTNPINFTKDFRVYDNYTWLSFGDGSANVLTAEFRTPFAGGKWQWRVRARYTGLSVDLNNDGIDEIDESGLGDIDMRFLTVLKLEMEKKRHGWHRLHPNSNLVSQRPRPDHRKDTYIGIKVLASICVRFAGLEAGDS